MTLQDLQLGFSGISTCLSLATLGFVLNLVRVIRENAKDRMDVQKERLEQAADQRTWLKDRHEREKADLTEKLEQTQSELDRLLKREGIDAAALAAGKRLSESAEQLRQVMQRLTEEMEANLSRLSGLGGRADKELIAASARRSAMVAMAYGNYVEAARQYDTYATSGTAGWEDHLSRGIAHANGGRDHASYVAALRAYNDAIAMAPGNLQGNIRARIFTYRAAMLKRLGRLREAEADLTLSLELATAEYERLDAHYNLACVYAMQRRGEDMYRHLSALENKSSFLASVSQHLDDYFAYYKSDLKLLEALQSRRAVSLDDVFVIGNTDVNDDRAQTISLSLEGAAPRLGRAVVFNWTRGLDAETSAGDSILSARWNNGHWRREW